MDSSAKSQLVEKLKSANSVLITVSRDPSVDQLAACIGLTLLVNKLGKHGSAVFSGEVPSTIEFLKPEETIEKTANSLRDFIIALDKNKADKLRYKVEDQMVKIFITPYKTSLSEKDLEFSQGDFNVDLVVALGVKNQEDLDQAIVTHGRILHDATVACINTKDKAELGTINWEEPTASSLCELVTSLSSAVGENLLDQQIATALLTGIIAETDRFSNEKTSSQTMSVSGLLMAAGANQQLVATNLGETAGNNNVQQDGSSAKDDNGTLSIKHEEGDLDVSTLPKPSDSPTEQLNDDKAEESDNKIEPTFDSGPRLASPPRLVTQPPALGGTLTANSAPEQYDPSTDPLSTGLPPAPAASLNPSNRPTIQPSAPALPATPPAYTPPPPTWSAPAPPPPAPAPAPPPLPPVHPEPQIDTTPKEDQTINELEKSVDSPHVNMPDANAAREQINAIISEGPEEKPQPDLALNALPLGQPLHSEPEPAKEPETPKTPTKNITGLDPSLFSEPPTQQDQAPPVPPPLFPVSENNVDSPDNTTKS